MKKTKLFFLVLLLCLLMVGTSARAQAVGDYGSAGTGSWGTDGTNWVVCVTIGTWTGATAAPGAPTTSTNVWIRAGHIITAEATGKTCNNLTVVGTGTLISTSNSSSTNFVTLSGTTLTLMANSTYKLAGTSAYMGIVWTNVSVDNNSTIEFDGTQSSLPLSTSSNSSITFGNLNWYAGTLALTSTTKYLQLIVNGNLTIGSSSTSTSKIRASTSNFASSLTHTVYGNLTINGTFDSSHNGLSLANSTSTGANITFDVRGSVYINSGKISMEESGGNPTSTLKIGGNLTIGDGGSVNAILQLATNSAQAGTSAVNVLGNVSVASNGSIAKNSGASGCSLAINLNGTTAQTWTGVFPLTFATGILCGVNINNAAGVSLFNAVTVNPYVTLTVNAGSILSTGYALTNSGTTNINGTLQLNSGGSIGSAPTYGSSSTLVYNTTYGTYNEWTGGASSSVAAGSGIPANVIIQSGTVTLAGGRGIPGNLTVNSGTGLVLNASAGDLYIGGNLTNNGSTWTNNTRAVFFVGSGTQTVSASGGTQYFDYLVLNKPSGSVKLSPATNVTINSTAGDVVQLNNTGVLDLNGQTLTLNGNGGNINLYSGARSINSSLANGILSINGTKAVINGGTLNTDANTNVILSAGFDPGSGLTTVNGTLQINGGGYVANNAINYGTGSTLNYNSAGTYGVSNEWTNSPTNVTVQNSTTVNLNGFKTINGTLTLTSGVLATGNNTLTLNGAISSGSGTINTTGGTLAFGGTIEQTLAASNLTSGAVNVLTVNANAKLTTTGAITATTLNILNDGTTGGTGTLKDVAGTLTATNAYVSQFINGGRNWYLSSPVTGATGSGVLATSTATTAPSYLAWYDESKGNPLGWTTQTSTALTSGLGYVAVNSTTTPSTDGTITFNGILNTGSKSVNLTYSSAPNYIGYNLVGNPFPSYANIFRVFDTNNDGVINTSDIDNNIWPTYWYRTQNISGYTWDSYNLAGGVPSSGSGLSLTYYIPPMQAFWLLSKSGGATLTMNSSLCSHQDITTNKFRAPAAINAVNQLLRLNVSNGTNTDDAVVYFNANAANGLDIYDSPKMSNNNVAIPEIYTTVGNENLVINGMNSITPDTEIPVGFTTGQSNAFSIKATEFSNFDANTKVYLKDNLLNTEQDLTDGTAYTFTSDVASTTSRFSVVFKSVGVTTGLQAASGDQAVLIYKNANNQIAVNCTGSISDNGYVSVYNALGQKLELTKITGSTTIISRTLASGVYVVTVNNGGKSTTKKVILN